jgi:hypothetical protein
MVRICLFLAWPGLFPAPVGRQSALADVCRFCHCDTQPTRRELMHASTDPAPGPTDAERSLRTAIAMAERGDDINALAVCRDAIATWPDILPLCRLQRDLARRLGDRDGMIAALTLLVRHDPDDLHAAAELAGLHCDNGDFGRAAQLLRPVAPVLGHAGNAIWNYSASLAIIGAHDELRATGPLLDRLAPDGPSPFPPYAPLAMARLGARFDRDTVIADAEAMQASAQWLDPRAVFAALEQAIAERSPFSLIRLDVALARFATCCTHDPKRLLRPQEVAAVLDSVWPGWFGVPATTLAPTFLADLQTAFLQAIAQADLIGTPDAADIRRETHHFGFLAEMHQLVRNAPCARLASTHIALLLHETIPYLRTVLGGQQFLGFVGPFPAMFAKLATFCGVSETLVVPVPRDAGCPTPEGGLASQGFLPDGHRRTIGSIVVPQQGAVFLVSAPGPLGVIYSGHIKRQGGIAVDIGPLAARWAGADSQ